jgi:hypothetical protein
LESAADSHVAVTLPRSQWLAISYTIVQQS